MPCEAVGMEKTEIGNCIKFKGRVSAVTGKAAT